MSRLETAVGEAAYFADERPRRHWSLRALAWFWAVLLLGGAVGAGVLQLLGAPGAAPSKPRVAATIVPATPVPTAPATELYGGVIPAPDPTLQEPAPAFPGLTLPRVGPNGRTPMQAYAAAVDPSDTRPRIAIMIAGMGMNSNESEAAARDLPAAISLAISPYAFRPAVLLDTARTHGHELFASVPMEPEGYPLADAGGQALLTGNSEAVNRVRLQWALSRFAGYVGATAALGPELRGERFEAATPAMAPVLTELAQRGLMFVDTRVGYGKPQAAVGRGIDVVIDEPAAVRGDIEAKLTRLEQIAHERGSAVGLASAPRPTTVATLASWAATLDARGIALMPVSAVAPLVPAAKPVEPPK